MQHDTGGLGDSTYGILHSGFCLSRLAIFVPSACCVQGLNVTLLYAWLGCKDPDGNSDASF